MNFTIKKKNQDFNNYFEVEWSDDEPAGQWVPGFDDNGEYIGRYWVSNFN